MKLISDVASYQLDSLSFMKKLRSKGINGLMVKLTDGVDYLNPKASNQVTNGFKSGMESIGLYHYFHGDGQAEAKYFLAWVKAFKMDKSTPLAIDVEEPTLPASATHQVNVFLKELKDAGYKCRVVYGSASWFNSSRINYAKLTDKNIWVASYGGTQPNVPHADAWQYTDNFRGMHVDASYDFSGVLTGSKFKTSLRDLYWQDGKLFEAITDCHVYKSLSLVESNRRRTFVAKRSRFYGVPVKNGSHGITTIKTKTGYVSANKKFVKKINFK